MGLLLCSLFLKEQRKAWPAGALDKEAKSQGVPALLF